MTIKVKNIDTSTIDGKIAVMQAYKNGAKIARRWRNSRDRIRFLNEWQIAPDPVWEWTTRDYAVIEEPRELWVIINDAPSQRGYMCAFPNKTDAEYWAGEWNKAEAVEDDHYRVAKFVEVQE